MRLLAISGSLRAASSNTRLLRAAARLSPPEARIELYSGLADLPHFNPDLDDEKGLVLPPPAVADFRRQLRASAGVLVCSPEYAHGVPGTLKNALDWVVGSGELVEKPFALINAAPHATHAQASLLETLATMSARPVPEAFVNIQLAGRKLDEDGLVADPEISALLRRVVLALVSAIPKTQIRA